LNADCLRDRQRNFAAALLDPNMPVPLGLVGPDRETSEKRFNVYRNNVVAGLVEALKAAFPAVEGFAIEVASSGENAITKIFPLEIAGSGHAQR